MAICHVASLTPWSLGDMFTVHGSLSSVEFQGISGLSRLGQRQREPASAMASASCLRRAARRRSLFARPRPSWKHCVEFADVAHPPAQGLPEGLVMTGHYYETPTWPAAREARAAAVDSSHWSGGPAEGNMLVVFCLRVPLYVRLSYVLGPVGVSHRCKRARLVTHAPRDRDRAAAPGGSACARDSDANCHQDRVCGLACPRGVGLTGAISSTCATAGSMASLALCSCEHIL